MIKTLLTCIDSKVENNRSLYGRFQLGPFQLGQGLTVANGLRRSMLSELTGIGIIAVEIKEAIHEYSTLKGIQESVFDILLNLKQIGIKSELPLNSPQIGFLQKMGPTVVRACDLKLPPFIQIVDPKQYIATVSRDGCLKLKILIWQGKNDSIQPFSIFFQKTNIKFTDLQKEEQVESNFLENKRTKNKQITKDFSFFFRETFLDSLTEEFETELLKDLDDKNNFIEHQRKFDLEKPFFCFKLDTIFTPVNNVNFVVEVENNLEEPKDRIILEIWTNGTIKPRDAIYGGAKALIKLFGSFQTILPTGNFSNLGNVDKNQEKISNSWTSFNQASSDPIYLGVTPKEGSPNEYATRAFAPRAVHFTTSNVTPFVKSTTTPFRGRPETEKDFGKSPQKYNFRSSYLYSLRLQTKETLTFKAHSNFISFFPQNWKRDSKEKNRQLKKWSFLQNENLNNNKAITQYQSFLSKNTNKIEKKTFLKKVNLKNRENSPLSNHLNSLDIENLDFSLRLFTLLKQANIHTLQDLVGYSRQDLLLIKGLNNKFVDQINKKLNKIEYFLIK